MSPQSYYYGSTTAAFHRSQAGYVRILWRLDNDEGGTGQLCFTYSWLRTNLAELARVWSSSMMEKVDAVESVTDPCSIAAPPPSGPASCSPRKHGQDRKRLKHCQEIRNRKGARKRTQTRNQSGRRNSPVVAKDWLFEILGRI